MIIPETLKEAAYMNSPSSEIVIQVPDQWNWCAEQMVSIQGTSCNITKTSGQMLQATSQVHPKKKNMSPKKGLFP